MVAACSGSENSPQRDAPTLKSDDGRCCDVRLPGTPAQNVLDSFGTLKALCDGGPRRAHPKEELMSALLVGYARVSTHDQDLTAQRDALAALGVSDERTYVDHGLTGANRERPGLREALAACRGGDMLVVTKARPPRAVAARRPRDPRGPHQA